MGLAFPSADGSAGPWLSNGPTLHDAVDEPVASDADYIYTYNTGVCVLNLPTIGDPNTDVGFSIRFRARSDNGVRQLGVSLMESGVIVTSNIFSNVPAAMTNYTFNIDPAVIGGIVNWNALAIRFEYLTALNAPVLTKTSASGAVLEFDAALASDTWENYWMVVESSPTNAKNPDGSYSSGSKQVIEHQITPQDRVTGIIPHADLVAVDGWNDPTGLTYVHAMFYRDDGLVSGWSNEITDTIVASVAALATTTGNSKSSLIAVSGTPALTATMSGNPGSLRNVRTDTPAANGKFHFEATILGFTNGVNGEVEAGCNDGTVNFNASSSYPVPGIGVAGFGAYVTKSSTQVKFQRNGSLVTAGVALPAAPAAGDALIFDVDKTVANPTVLVRWFRASDSSVTTIGTITMTSLIPASGWYAHVAGFNNNTPSGGISGDSCKINFGATSFLVAASTGYGIYG